VSLSAAVANSWHRVTHRARRSHCWLKYRQAEAPRGKRRLCYRVPRRRPLTTLRGAVVSGSAKANASRHAAPLRGCDQLRKLRHCAKRYSARSGLPLRHQPRRPPTTQTIEHHVTGGFGDRQCLLCQSKPAKLAARVESPSPAASWPPMHGRVVTCGDSFLGLTQCTIDITADEGGEPVGIAANRALVRWMSALPARGFGGANGRLGDVPAGGDQRGTCSALIRVSLVRRRRVQCGGSGPLAISLRESIANGILVKCGTHCEQRRRRVATRTPGFRSCVFPLQSA